jgi:hypothetical protein
MHRWFRERCGLQLCPRGRQVIVIQRGTLWHHACGCAKVPGTVSKRKLGCQRWRSSNGTLGFPGSVLKKASWAR